MKYLLLLGLLASAMTKSNLLYETHYGCFVLAKSYLQSRVEEIQHRLINYDLADQYRFLLVRHFDYCVKRITMDQLLDIFNNGNIQQPLFHGCPILDQFQPDDVIVYSELDQEQLVFIDAFESELRNPNKVTQETTIFDQIRSMKIGKHGYKIIAAWVTVLILLFIYLKRRENNSKMKQK